MTNQASNRYFLELLNKYSKELFEAWPPNDLRKRYPALIQYLSSLMLLKKDWADIVEKLPESLKSTGHSPAYISSTDQLREISAAISMTVHLKPQLDKAGVSSLMNDRRKRTQYGSYPTPPAVGIIIAEWLAHVLPKKRQLSIADPTIEGAPILLEVSRVLAGRSSIHIHGIDRNSAAISAVRKLFASAKKLDELSFILPHLHIANAFEKLPKLGPLDAIVSNPPWGESVSNSEAVTREQPEPFINFVELSLECLKENGAFAFVLPGQMIAAKVGSKLRQKLVEKHSIDAVITLPTSCFRRATVRTVLILGRKGNTYQGRTSCIHISNNSEKPIKERTILQKSLGGSGPWHRSITLESKPRFRNTMTRLGDVCKISNGILPYRLGYGTPRQSEQTLRDRPFTYSDPKSTTIPVVASKGVKHFDLCSPTEHILPGIHLAYCGNHFNQRTKERLFLREICSRNGKLVCGIAPNGSVPRHGVFAISLESEADLNVLMGAINSDIIAQWVRTNCEGIFKESFNRIRIGDIRNMPIPDKLLDRNSSFCVEIDSLMKSLSKTLCTQKRACITDQIELLLKGYYR